tara:strand:- start:38 stop:271 length:234 start_codon:yes stop_codon:yes gene_type:complete
MKNINKGNKMTTNNRHKNTIKVLNKMDHEKIDREVMISRISRKLDKYFYTHEIKKVDDFVQNIFNEGQKETIKLIKK